MLNWLVVWNIFDFPIYWVSNHPNWLSYVSEGWPNHQPVKINPPRSETLFQCVAFYWARGVPEKMAPRPWRGSSMVASHRSSCRSAPWVVRVSWGTLWRIYMKPPLMKVCMFPPTTCSIFFPGEIGWQFSGMPRMMLRHGTSQLYIWLVVWNIFYFPIYWVSNHLNWLSYFSER